MTEFKDETGCPESGCDAKYAAIDLEVAIVSTPLDIGTYSSAAKFSLRQLIFGGEKLLSDCHIIF